MKQTAVEWQFEQLFNSFEKFNNGECTFNDYLKKKLEIREQANEIFKQQIIDARKDGINKCFRKGKRKEITNLEYYNETFK